MKSVKNFILREVFPPTHPKTTSSSGKNNHNKIFLNIFLLTGIFILLINFSVAARLPTVSSDADTWGDILNAFLRISHEEGGYLRNINNSVEGITNVDGNLTASGNVSTPLICLNGACQSSWGADSLWTNVSGTATYVGNVNVTQGVYINGYFINSSNYINQIVESGNNSNGSYIKFIDGTMIQSGTKTNTVTTSTITFPVSFYDTSYHVTATGYDTGANYFVMNYLDTKTISNATGRWASAPQASNLIDWQAIGKWTNTPYNTSTITVGGGIPSGAIVAYNRTSCPVGWILADGNSGTPDLRGIFIRGSGTNSILKYANGSYFSVANNIYSNDSFQSHKFQRATIGSSPYRGAYLTGGTGNTNPYQDGTGTEIILNDIITDGTNGAPRNGSETSPAYYSTIYCVKTTEDTATSNTIWATSGNNVLLNNASMNVNITGNLSVVGTITPKAQVFRANMSAAFSHPGGVWVALPFNRTIFNTLSGNFNVTNYSFTPSKAGYYQVSVSGYSPTSTTADQRYGIGAYKNGINDGFTGGSFSSADNPLAGYNAILYLNTTDVIDIRMYSNTAITLGGGGAGPGHEMFWYMNYLGN